MNLDMMQPEAKPLAKQEIVLAAFFDDEERQLRAPLCYWSACPLGLAGLKTILREALLAQAASIEITLSAASEGMEEFLAEARLSTSWPTPRPGRASSASPCAARRPRGDGSSCGWFHWSPADANDRAHDSRADVRLTSRASAASSNFVHMRICISWVSRATLKPGLSLRSKEPNQWCADSHTLADGPL